MEGQNHKRESAGRFGNGALSRLAGLRAVPAVIAVLGVMGMMGVMPAARAGDCLFYFKDGQNVPQPNRPVVLYYLGAPSQFNVTNIIVRDRLYKTTDTNGFFGLTNYVDGIWREEHQGAFGPTTNWLNLPRTNGTIFASDPAWSTVATNATSGSTVGYSQAAANARFVINAGLASEFAATNTPAAGQALGSPDGTNLAWITAGGGQTQFPLASVTNAGGLNALQTNNGAALTNLSGDAPWKIPMVGTARSKLVDYATVCDATHNITNLNVAGTGVVTSIRIVFEGGASTYSLLTNHIGHMSYDGGPDVINFPWVYFLGLMTTQLNEVCLGKVRTDFFRIDDLQPGQIDFQLGFDLDNGGYITGFTNGCKIWTTTAASVNMASGVEYQDAMAVTPFSYMRFRPTNMVAFLNTNTLPAGTVGFNTANPTSLIGVGTHFDATNVGHYFVLSTPWNLEVAEPLIVAVTNATSALVDWGTMVTHPVKTNTSGIPYDIPKEFHWLTRPAGTVGFVAAVIGFQTNWLVQANMRWFINQETTPAYECWDMEQFWGCNHGFAIAPKSLDPTLSVDRGMSSFSDDQEYIGGFRFFTRRPVFYRNGFDGEVNHQTGIGGPPFYPSLMNFVAIVYE